MWTPLIIFLIPAIVIWDNGHAQTTIITCSAGTGLIGQPSNVTCHFHTDIKASKISISVSMISSSAGEEKRDVLQCSWGQQGYRPECIVTNGYNFNYEVSNHITIEIPSTTHEHAGIYSCHVVPPKGTTVKQCRLGVKERATEIPTSTRRLRQLPQLRTPEPSTDCQNETVSTNTVLLIILIILVIGAIAGYIIYKNKTALSTRLSRLRQTSKREENDDRQENPDTELKKEDEDPESQAECGQKDSIEVKSETQTQEETEHSSIDVKKPLLSDDPSVIERSVPTQHVPSNTPSQKKNPAPPPPKLPANQVKSPALANQVKSPALPSAKAEGGLDTSVSKNLVDESKEDRNTKKSFSSFWKKGKKSI